MKVALFDHIVSVRSPAGSCDVRVLQAVRAEHQVTVFASELSLPDSKGPVEHVPLRSVHRPALAAFVVYFIRACASYARQRIGGTRFDLIQATDCGFWTADVCYAHFCHRTYLSEVWPRMRMRATPRTLHHWLGHATRAAIERRLVRRARVVVAPSEGLARDLSRAYPGIDGKVVIIRNTVDLERFGRPAGFDRRVVRERLGTTEGQTAFVFVALGHFERKGLPLLLEALRADGLQDAHLWVVGGEAGLVDAYRAIARRLGVAGRVRFVGKTDDVRRFLWSADAFVAPSHYEAFSLGLLEAAAAGLPLIATRISGSEELVRPGLNGFEVERTPAGIATGLRRFLELGGAEREAMRRAARESVEPLRPERFAEAWRTLYASLANPAQTGAG